MGTLELMRALSVQRQTQPQPQRPTNDGSIASVAERKGLPSPCQQANSSQGRGAETMEPELTLPEDILYKIHALPLLPMREAARAACLSRGFLHSWRCCPNLIFDMRALGKTEDACKKDETRADAISRVNRVMPNK